ncbi:hypothetical protein ACFV1L_06105 [Kitasatospora sp. NPDC059646]|uniref:hypothetical protein n=1 Tax=Kitasatospora sp. NPDC059646 TaxID=3346893 RepID=UPI00369007DF
MRVTHLVEVRRAPIVADAYTKQRDWDSSVKVWSGWASVQPDRSAGTRSPERETNFERLALFFPADAAVEAADRVTVDGIVYEVEAPPQPWTQRRAISYSRVTVWRTSR